MSVLAHVKSLMTVEEIAAAEKEYQEEVAEIEKLLKGSDVHSIEIP